MRQQKQCLVQELQQKKCRLKELEEKCELQNKKIKLFRKENQELTWLIEERQQADTNLLLQSKEILSNNSKLEKTITELRQQLEKLTVKKQLQATNTNPDNIDMNRKGQNQHKENNQNQSSPLQAINNPIAKLNTIKDLIITSATLQLDLPACELTDSELTPVAALTQLKYLTLNHNLLTSPSVEIICLHLVNLEKLNLAGNKFKAESLACIKNLKQLKALDVRNNDLGDDAIKYISEVESLRELSCSKNYLTDSCAIYIAKLSQLIYLDITNNSITSASVQDLVRLQKVTHLYLMSNGLGKEAIVEIIRSCKNLQLLDVRFNVQQNDQKQQIKNFKTQILQILC